MTDLEQRIRELARAPVLLVASDYDGTLAPIVDDPEQARPHRETIVALQGLATLPNTHVAVISGRALRELARLSGFRDGVHLVGSHGGEFDLDFAKNLPSDLETLREEVWQELSELARQDGGFMLERKPTGVAFHYRNAQVHTADEVVRAVLRGPGATPGVHARHGKKVVELSVVETNKGRALEQLRARVGASATVFVGDDLTDEDAFATLTGPDVGVKVGEGETAAGFRVEDTEEVARTLARLYELRTDWLAGEDAVPIEEHSLLSDNRTFALLTPDARLTWLCLPRADSSAIFAELLGGPAAGLFSIAPADGSGPLRQTYVGDSMVVETEFPGFTVTDFFDASDGRPYQRAGRCDLLRIVEGRGRVVVRFAPRLDFGRVPTRLALHANGLQVLDSPDPVVLRAPHVQWELAVEGQHQTARAEVDLRDQRIVLDLRYGTGSLDDTRLRGPERLRATKDYWERWCEELTIPAVESELVRRSALVLKALCHSPTGGIAAAATTSLPEHIGGVRNWDYRYCWLRDAAMSAASLVKLGSHKEAMSFLDWVLGILEGGEPAEKLRPLYTVSGGQVMPDAEIGELSGYRGSRPVRVGNSAAIQVQLDVFGPIVDLVQLLHERGAPLSGDHWRLVQAMADAVVRRWAERDHGIWEIRRPPCHHVHSKTMCWLTLERAIQFSRSFLERDQPAWSRIRDEIREDVLANGWKPHLAAFAGTYESDEELDAAVLMVGLSGLLDPKDKRFVSTVESVERGLRSGPTVYRYRTDDGLPGYEGGFHLCAGWLVEAYLRIGRLEQAWELFRSWTELSGPTQLFSEQYGPTTKRALGNHPQAYSHIALIENALSLAAAPRG